MQPHLCHTVEARWFLAGEQNETSWLAWFLADSALPLLQDGEEPPGGALFARAEPARLDRYMIVPAGGPFSIKQRQGNLEVKVQLSPPQSFQSGAVTGNSDAWMKWSFAPHEDSVKMVFAEELQLSASWIDVEKRRHVIRVGGDVAKGLSPLPASEGDPASHCQFDLTFLSLPTAASEPSHWLTLGIELRVCSGQTAVSIAEACRAFMWRRGTLPAELTAASAQNFPAWLSAQVFAPAATAA